MSAKITKISILDQLEGFFVISLVNNFVHITTDTNSLSIIGMIYSFG